MNIAAKLGHIPIRNMPIADIRPAPQNDKVYRPIDPNAPDIIELAESIAERGILEPLVISLDKFILSGNRRYTAAKRAGLATVPCRVVAVSSEDDPDEFLRLLVEHNRQREKSSDEKMREAVVAVNPEQAYESLLEHRRHQAIIPASDRIDIGDVKRRSRITAAKRPLLDAVMRVLHERREFLPLSDRAIHYPLLNDPPLIHASKPHSRYHNDHRSYKAVVDILTRARLTGEIPMDWIADETRPVSVWNVHAEVGGFIRKELDGFMKGYWRDLMRSQPNHIELVGEKNTLKSILAPVAMEYCIPLTTGRGQCSIPPRAAMDRRFRQSGKEKLILLVVSDFDPDGESIAQAYARSMRDDFHIKNIEARKVGLTQEQVNRFQLPPDAEAKIGSSQYRKFVAKYGPHVFEVEALSPAVLQQELRAAIDGVIDIEAFNAELNREKEDAAKLEAYRQRIKDLIGDETL